MKGSGIEEVIGLVFGASTVEHVLSGKAYARAVRGHFLIHTALTDMLLVYLHDGDLTSDDDQLSPVNLDNDIAEGRAGSVTDSVLASLKQLYSRTLTDKADIENLQLFESDSVEFLSQQLISLISVLIQHCRTSQYMEYVELVRTFLLADRTSDWLLWLDSVSKMLPLFAATGHNNYAKAACIYLQEMRDLPSTYPWLNEQFLAGHCTVRRSDRLWAGLAADLVIEQTMMRAVKSRGGLTFKNQCELCGLPH